MTANRGWKHLGRARPGRTPVVSRMVAALLLAIGGGVHLDLWRDGYRGIRYIGPLFLANVIVSGIVAARLVLGGGRPTALAGLAIAVGSLAGLALSRTVGLFGFVESGWTPAAARAVAAEIGAVVTIGLVLALSARSGRMARLAPAVVKATSRRSDRGQVQHGVDSEGLALTVPPARLARRARAHRHLLATDADADLHDSVPTHRTAHRHLLPLPSQST